MEGNARRLHRGIAKYPGADRVSDQNGDAETDTENRMSGTNEMHGKAGEGSQRLSGSEGVNA